jgi:hypothetical protein
LPVSKRASVVPGGKFDSPENYVNTEDMQPLFRQSKEASQAAVELPAIKARQQAAVGEAQTKGETKAFEDYKKAIEGAGISDELNKVIERRNREFIPTQETAGDLATMFTITNLVGFALGGLAKGHAQQAMSAMNGMLEGHIKGRDDEYKKQKTIYEENQKALDKLVTTLQEKKKEAMELAKTDYDGALIKLKEQLHTIGAPFAAEYADKQGLVALGEYADKMIDKVEKLRKLNQDHQDKIDREKREEKRDANLAAFRQKEIALREREVELREQDARNKLAKAEDDFNNMLRANGVYISDKKAREQVGQAIGSVAELQSLQQEVKNNPALVGRQGQIKQFTDKWINSFKTGGEEPTASQADQDALLFAKKYASMLTRYELALAGTARGGSTVSFQNRYNNLLSQNQFDAPSLIKLFDDMQTEVTRGARERSTNITPQLMNKFANTLNAPFHTTQTTQPENGFKIERIP